MLFDEARFYELATLALNYHGISSYACCPHVTVDAKAP